MINVLSTDRLIVIAHATYIVTYLYNDVVYLYNDVAYLYNDIFESKIRNIVNCDPYLLRAKSGVVEFPTLECVYLYIYIYIYIMTSDIRHSYPGDRRLGPKNQM